MGRGTPVHCLSCRTSSRQGDRRPFLPYLVREEAYLALGLHSRWILWRFADVNSDLSTCTAKAKQLCQGSPPLPHPLSLSVSLSLSLSLSLYIYMYR